MMTINLDDANLTEILKKIIAEAEIAVGDLFDDQDILDHVHDGGMPIDEIFGEDEVLGCGCVIDALEQEREDCEQETMEKYEEEIEEYQSQVAQLEETIGELKRENAELTMKKENAEFLREKMKEKMEEWNAKMDATHADLTKSVEDAVAEHKKKNDKLKALYRAKCEEWDAIVHENLGELGKCYDGRGGWFELLGKPNKDGSQRMCHVIPKE